MSGTTLKFSKKMENEIISSTITHLLKEKNYLDEASLDWLTKIPLIKKIFDKEKQADATQGQRDVQPSSITSVEIPRPYPEDKKKDILKDPEVKKLMAKLNYTFGMDKYGGELAKTLEKYPAQVDQIISDYIKAAGVENTYSSAAGGGESSEVSIENEIFPILSSEFGIKGYDERTNYIELLKSFLNAKVANNLPEDLYFLASEKYFFQKAKDLGLKDQEAKVLRDLIGKKKVIKEQLAITNLSETDIAELVNEINKFYPYAKEYLGFDKPVELTLISDPDNAKDTFGKTAYYNPASEQMTIFVDERHPKDIIRSFSHELVHHTQNCRGEFDRDFSVGENYIETDDHLKEMEREAYDKGNMCLRTYESYLKKENKAMNEETLRKSIREAIKRVAENKTHAVKETVVTEDGGEDEAWHQWKNEHADDDHIKEIEHHLRALKGDRDYEEHGAEYDHDKYEDEDMDEAADVNTGLENPTDKPEGTSYGHVKEEVVEEDEDYTAKKEKPGEDKRKGAEERGAEGTLAKTKGHGKVDYVNEDESTATPLYESMAIKKGQLVFDRLVNKWCK
jgi:hypothetical protein